jgi:serine/threonine protein kinase
MTADVFGIVGTTQRGSFRVERVVAEGGFSVVYKAYHGAFRAPVALKCLKVPGSMSAAEADAFLEKLREEAELLFRLSASIPEVVRPLHVDALELRDRFVPFLALEWLEGEALDEMLGRRQDEGHAPMGLHKLVRLLTPVARGLVRAHRFPGPAGTISVIHRDIKPENILIATVNGEEVVKILDFGIAKAQAVAELRATRTADEDDVRSAFTPAYGAPEQWAPRQYGSTGPWTDVWGLAMTMVEALVGRQPISGDMPQMLASVIDPHRRPSPRSLGAVVAEDVEQAFLRALEVDPKTRTQDIETFWGDLESALGMTRSLGRQDSRRDVAPPSSRVSPPPLEASGPSPYAATVEAIDVPVSAVKPPTVPTLERPVPSSGKQAANGPVSSAAPSSLTPSKRRVVSESEGPLSLDAVDVSAQLDLDPRSGFHRGPQSSLGPRPPLRSSAPVLASAIPERSRDLRALLKAPFQLALLGVLVGVLDVVASRVLGETLAFGSIRPLWASVALVLCGVLLGFWRLLGDDS